ncbi:type IV toxin-antitoxin system YeeU family antitoxin, partial [Escherichia coli]|uniref:type IV toxin-antitoxin system YeeU family antitoxin n=1 Tax=Escherichia coli TaxID=562 RepID=UPI0021140956
STCKISGCLSYRILDSGPDGTQTTLTLMLTSGELNPRHQHTVTLYAKGLTCKADTLSSCGYVYLAVYPTPEMKN